MDCATLDKGTLLFFLSSYALLWPQVYSYIIRFTTFITIRAKGPANLVFWVQVKVKAIILSIYKVPDLSFMSSEMGIHWTLLSLLNWIHNWTIHNWSYLESVSAIRVSIAAINLADSSNPYFYFYFNISYSCIIFQSMYDIQIKSLFLK